MNFFKGNSDKKDDEVDSSDAALTDQEEQINEDNSSSASITNSDHLNTITTVSDEPDSTISSVVADETTKGSTEQSIITGQSTVSTESGSTDSEYMSITSGSTDDGDKETQATATPYTDKQCKKCGFSWGSFFGGIFCGFLIIIISYYAVITIHKKRYGFYS